MVGSNQSYTKNILIRSKIITFPGIKGVDCDFNNCVMHVLRID